MDPRPRRPAPTPRQIARIVAPVAVASVVMMAVGVVLVVVHQRTAGIVVFVIGALGGFLLRARLVWRAQVRPGGDPPRR